MKVAIQRGLTAFPRLGTAGVFLIAFGFSLAHAQNHVGKAGDEIHCAVCHVASLTPLPGAGPQEIPAAGSFRVAEALILASGLVPVPASSPKLSRAPPNAASGSPGALS